MGFGRNMKTIGLCNAALCKARVNRGGAWDAGL
jgi:hypothetical protein